MSQVLFHVVQESLSNAAKQPGLARRRAHRQDANSVHLTVPGQRSGFALKDTEQRFGHGLRSMRRPGRCHWR